MTFQPITRGVICPTITPLKPNGDINPAMIPPLVDYLIDRGIAGIYPLGSTGEGPLFNVAERQAIAEATVEAVAGRVPVIIHTGAASTRDTIALTKHARDIGADAASVITPWYYRHSEAALEAHYRAILEAVPGFPVYLYNLPNFANNTLSLALVTRLARAYDNCVGLKDSSGDLMTMCAVNHLQDGRFNTAIGPRQFDPGRLGAGAGLQRLRQQQSLPRAARRHSRLVPRGRSAESAAHAKAAERRQ